MTLCVKICITIDLYNIKINKGATLLPIKASALLNTNKGLISISFYGNEESSL
jgi:hypothetical protein